MTDEQQAWDGLLTHPGWHLFAAEAKKRWGAVGYGWQLKQAVSRAITDHTSPDAAIKAVDFASNEINALVDFPKQRLKTLLEATAHEAEAPLISRRGPNL